MSVCASYAALASIRRTRRASVLLKLEFLFTMVREPFQLAILQMADDGQQAQALSFVTTYSFSCDSQTSNTAKATSVFAKLYDARILTAWQHHYES